jgi:hypothetical protein
MTSRSLTKAIGFAVGLLCITAAAAGARELTVEFQFNRLNRIASNQFAVWVEDSDGHLVKTLFVTDFTARKSGYRRRPAALPMWVRAFDPASHTTSEVDAVSRPTPDRGLVVLSWNGTNAAGKAVPPGVYRVHIEGNIYWENMIYFTIPVDIGSLPFSFEAMPSDGSADPAADQPLITGVRVSYLP